MGKVGLCGQGKSSWARWALMSKVGLKGRLSCVFRHLCHLCHLCHLLYIPQHGITLTWCCGLIPFGMTNDPFSFEEKHFSAVRFFCFYFCIGPCLFSKNVVLSGPIVNTIIYGSTKGLANEIGLVS